MRFGGIKEDYTTISELSVCFRKRNELLVVQISKSCPFKDFLSTGTINYFRFIYRHKLALHTRLHVGYQRFHFKSTS